MKAEKILNYFVLALITTFIITSLTFAQSVPGNKCYDHCDIRLSGPISTEKFQKILNSASDANRDGEIKVCLQDNTIIANIGVNGEYTPAITVTIPKNNLTIEGISLPGGSKPQMYMYAVNGSSDQPNLLTISGVSNIRIKNISFYSNITRGNIIYTKASSSLAETHIAEVSDVVFRIDSAYVDGILVSKASNEGAAKIDLVSNVSTVYESNGFGYGIENYGGHIEHIDNLNFTSKRSPENNTANQAIRGMKSSSGARATFGEISNINIGDKVVAMGVVVSYGDVNKISNLKGTLTQGLTYGITINFGSCADISNITITGGTYGLQFREAKIKNVRNITLSGSQRGLIMSGQITSLSGFRYTSSEGSSYAALTIGQLNTSGLIGILRDFSIITPSDGISMKAGSIGQISSGLIDLNYGAHFTKDETSLLPIPKDVVLRRNGVTVPSPELSLCYPSTTR